MVEASSGQYFFLSLSLSLPLFPFFIQSYFPPPSLSFLAGRIRFERFETMDGSRERKKTSVETRRKNDFKGFSKEVFPVVKQRGVRSTIRIFSPRSRGRQLIMRIIQGLAWRKIKLSEKMRVIQSSIRYYVNGKAEDKFWTSFCRREEYFYTTIQKLQWF